jgi:hypothetical protein
LKLLHDLTRKFKNGTTVRFLVPWRTLFFGGSDDAGEKAAEETRRPILMLF